MHRDRRHHEGCFFSGTGRDQLSGFTIPTVDGGDPGEPGVTRETRPDQRPPLPPATSGGGTLSPRRSALPPQGLGIGTGRGLAPPARWVPFSVTRGPALRIRTQELSSRRDRKRRVSTEQREAAARRRCFQDNRAPPPTPPSPPPATRRSALAGARARSRAQREWRRCLRSHLSAPGACPPRRCTAPAPAGVPFPRRRRHHHNCRPGTRPAGPATSPSSSAAPWPRVPRLFSSAPSCSSGSGLHLAAGAWD